VELQYFKYNTQSLLREVRYDPRLRVLTTFPIAEVSQLRQAAPAGTLKDTAVT